MHRIFHILYIISATRQIVLIAFPKFGGVHTKGNVTGFHVVTVDSMLNHKVWLLVWCCIVFHAPTWYTLCHCFRWASFMFSCLITYALWRSNTISNDRSYQVWYFQRESIRARLWKSNLFSMSENKLDIGARKFLNKSRESKCKATYLQSGKHPSREKSFFNLGEQKSLFYLIKKSLPC